MKPDILAPGGYVVGAMASLADPRKAAGGMFDSTGDCADTANNSPPQCPDNTNHCLCYLIDDWHGVAVGTSMASPIVAGTVALRFESNPALTQDDVRHYIQAGAQQPLEILTLAQEGPGVLDVNGALQALANEPTPSGAANGIASWMTVSTGLVHPDDQWPTLGTLHLRDSQNRPVTLDPSRISINFSPGHFLTPIESEGYGYYTFSFTAGAGTGRQMMNVDVLVDKRPLLSETLYIGVDVPSARGYVVAGRGCSIASRFTNSAGGVLGLLITLAALGFNRRSRHVSRA